jgi:hypothetical protein
MNWKTDLSEIISGYFTDASVEEGARELALVSASDPSFHQTVQTALRKAIEAASRGEQEIVRILRGNLIVHVDDTAKAIAYLDRILASYLDKYREDNSQEH